jgi:hypothetical protein
VALFEIQMKYGDVVPLEDLLDRIEALPPQPEGPRSSR